jgi:hypothetical protein
MTAELSVADAAQVGCVDWGGSPLTPSAVTSTVLSGHGLDGPGPPYEFAQRLDEER